MAVKCSLILSIERLIIVSIKWENSIESDAGLLFSLSHVTYVEKSYLLINKKQKIFISINAHILEGNPIKET